MTADLKPCPFCGGKASAWNLTLEGAVHCADCRATIVRQHPPVHDTGYNKAIAAWNTRATPAALTPEVRALVEAAEAALANLRMGKSPSQILQAQLELERGLAALREIEQVTHGGNP